MTPENSRKERSGFQRPYPHAGIAVETQRGVAEFRRCAWWPYSRDLTVELPDLLTMLSVGLGRIGRVLYNMNEWPEPTTTDRFRRLAREPWRVPRSLAQ